MKIRPLAVLCIALAIVATSSVTAGAQDATAKPEATDSHTAAIEEFLGVMKMEETTKRTIDQMLSMQMQANPQMAAFEDIMKGFLQKHLAYDKMKPDLIKLYKGEFTEDEMKQLAAFYRTPVGQKAIEKLPMLTAAGAQLGSQRVQANMGELQEAMAKRQAELQAESAPPKTPAPPK